MAAVCLAPRDEVLAWCSLRPLALPIESVADVLALESSLAACATAAADGKCACMLQLCRFSYSYWRLCSACWPALCAGPLLRYPAAHQLMVRSLPAYTGYLDAPAASRALGVSLEHAELLLDIVSALRSQASTLQQPLRDERHAALPELCLLLAVQLHARCVCCPSQQQLY